MSDVIVLNHGLESRTSKSGKQRYTITVKSEPVVVNADPRELGKPIAEAIAHHFRERIKGITELASPATIRARKAAREAFARGEQWALRRYGGGRMGAREPGQSDRKFNDSGRFAESITANASSDGKWRINVAANRLDPTTAGGESGVLRIWNELVRLVPEFGDPSRLLESDILRKAIEKSTRDLVRKAQARTSELRVEAAKSLLGIGRQVVGILDSLAG